MGERSLVVGIDASNIRAGGGLTHLSRVLAAGDPMAAGIGRVIVWGGAATLGRLPERDWLAKRVVATLDRALPWRVAWQQLRLPRLAGRERCDLLFAPGGTLPARVPCATVTMSQNMLPFEPAEAARFGRGSAMWWKLRLLRVAQGRSMAGADGVVFLTRYARDHVLAAIAAAPPATRIIPHGLEPRFFNEPRRPVRRPELGPDRPFRLLYVSQVDLYKHQWNVVRAAGMLRAQGVPVSLDLVGGAFGPALVELERALGEVDPDARFVRYRGLVPFEELHRAYAEADAFVFASSCENMPNILLEAMASGLPIASSSLGPMPEVLDRDAEYFDPLEPSSIAAALRRLIDDPTLRGRLAEAAYRRARPFSWERCASDTFAFLASVARHRSAAGGEASPDAITPAT